MSVAISMEASTHCVNCEALIYVSEQIDGHGLRCGCLKKYVMDLKNKLKTIQQSDFFNEL